MTRQTRMIAAAGCGLLLTAGAVIAQTPSVWTGVAGTDWFEGQSWDPPGVPGPGAAVTVNSGDVLLTNATATLAAFTMAGGTLTFSNWNTRLSAEAVTIGGGTVTLPPAFTNSQMSNRVWFACTDFTLGAGATINAEGKGYNTGLSSASSGFGPGAGGGTSSGGGGGGHGGPGGGTVTAGRTIGAVYGSAAQPVCAGSGGGWGNQNGGPGGGVVRIEAAGNVTVNGAINADGLKAPWVNGGGGSGGSVWISCRALAGTGGVVTARGGVAGTGGSPNGNGGGGRVAIDYDAETQRAVGRPDITFSTLPGMRATGRPADVGTLRFPDAQFLEGNVQPRLSGHLAIPGFDAWSLDHLTVSNVWLRLSNTGFSLTVSNALLIAGSEGRLDLGGDAFLYEPAETGGRGYSHINYSDTPNLLSLTCGGNLSLTNGGSLAAYAARTNGQTMAHGARVCVAGELTIGTNCTLTASSHPSNGGSVLWQVGSLTLAGASSRFSADVQGFPGGYSATLSRGFGPGGGGVRCGGSHGGKAGDYNSGAAATYGVTNRPTLPGSGGGWGGADSYNNDGTAGGGLIWVEAADRITVNGTITVNGGPVEEWKYHPGGGSGGAILLACRRFKGTATGKLLAEGGNADQVSYARGTGGGGGRIAVWAGAPYEDGVPASRLVVSETPFSGCALGSVSVKGGTGGAGDASRSGAAGTVRFIEVRAPGGTAVVLR